MIVFRSLTRFARYWFLGACQSPIRILLLFPLLLASVAASPQGQDPLQQHYDAASKFLQASNPERAATEYKAFLAEALHRIANGKADAGQFNAAGSLFEESLALSPDDADLKLDYARACFDADQLVKAKSLAEPVASAPNSSPEARFLLARVLFHLGDFPPVEPLLQKVYAEKPEFHVGYLLAKTYLLLHHEQAAHDLLQRMAAKFGDTAVNDVYFGRIYSETDHLEEAIAEFHRAMGLDPHAPDAHYYLGLAYLGHNESAGYAQAIPEFHAEVQLEPNDFRSHYMLGYIALKQRNLPEAETELLSALAEAPGDLQSHMLMAEVYTDTSRLPEAEKELRATIALAADNPANEGHAGRAHYQLGRILERTGRREEAAGEMKIVADIQRRLGPSSMQVTEVKKTREVQDDLRQVNADPQKIAQLTHFIDGLKPAIAGAYDNLGVISANARDFATAATYFQKAGAWDPSLAGLDRSLGTSLFYAGEYADAVPPLRRNLSANPSSLPARSLLALSLYKAGDFRSVIETLQPVATDIGADQKLAFAYVDSYFQVGRFQLEAGQIDAAVASLEAAAKLAPKNAAVHRQLALAYRRAGREPEAQQEEKTALTLQDQR